MYSQLIPYLGLGEEVYFYTKETIHFRKEHEFKK